MIRLALLALILGGIVWIALDHGAARQVRQTILSACPPAKPSTICHILVVLLDDH
jgi:hypothetical protein